MNIQWKIGDSLNYMREIPDKYFDLILTDPPYGINAVKEQNDRGNKQYGKAATISNKYICSDWDKEIPPREYFNEMMRISKHQIIFGGNHFTHYLYPSSVWIVWNKNTGNNRYSDCELAWTSFTGAIRKYDFTWNGMLQDDMKRKERRMYPTQKPVGLIEAILLDYSNKDDIICDPFLGSGSTLEACMNIERACIGFEINPACESMYIKRLRLDNAKLDAYNTPIIQSTSPH